MLYVGHTRFSLLQPDSGAWRASNGSRFADRRAYREYLFDDRRLGPRTDVFVEQSIPQLALAQRSHQLRHVVSYSEEMPLTYQRRLEDAARANPFVVLDPQGEAATTRGPMAIAREELGASGGLFGFYRLDDDDLLSADFFDRMDEYVTPAHVGYMVSLGCGITGSRSGNQYFDLRRCHYPMLAVGLLAVCRVHPGGRIDAPVSAPHTRSDLANPVIIDSRSPAYFWARHPYQDSALADGLPGSIETAEGLAEELARYPRITDEPLAELFPAVAHQMHRVLSPSFLRPSLLGDRVTLSASPIEIELPSLDGRVVLAARLAGGARPEKSAALVAMTLRRLDGEPLSDDQVRTLKKAGIGRSPHPAVGFFRYLACRPEGIEVEHVLDLPEGVVLDGVALRTWVPEGVEIEIEVEHVVVHEQ